MIPIFRDNSINEQFETNGFVKLTLFNSTQVKELRDFYFSIESKQNQVKEAYYATSHFDNPELMMEVSNFIKPYFLKELQRYLINCEYTISNFLVKQSSENSEVKCHEDWTFVDESQFVSFNVWVCLDDANHKTGNMQFIPGSHQFSDSIRASPDLPRYYDKIRPILSEYLIDVPTKAGECLIFSHSTIHASRINRSKNPRIACVIGGRTGDSDIFHFYSGSKNPPYIIEKYKMSIPDFIYLKNQDRPPLKNLVETFHYTPYFMPEKEFRQKAKKYTSILKILKNRISNILFK